MEEEDVAEKTPQMDFSIKNEEWTKKLKEGNMDYFINLYSELTK